MVGSLASLAWLTLGAFPIGTEGFMIAGLLPALALHLDVGLPAAGHRVTAFALAYALGAPVLAVLTAGLERKRLLAIAMGGFTLANLLAALAPGYVGLKGARLLLALSAATFMPAASGYAAGLGGPERRGRALSMVIGGLTVEIIAGLPLGVLLGDAPGRRATFLAVAGLAAVSLLGILAWLPRQQPKVIATPPGRAPGASQAGRHPVGPGDHRADRRQHRCCLHLSGRLLQTVTGLGLHGLAAVLPAFGIAGAIGTRVAGITADHWGARRTVIWGFVLVLLAYLALALGTAFPQASMLLLLPAILLWGFASWGGTTAQQARLVAVAPDLAPASLSRNSSAIYLGSATGAVVGALVVADGAVRMLGGVAACFSLAPLLTVLASAWEATTIRHAREFCDGRGTYLGKLIAVVTGVHIGCCPRRDGPRIPLRRAALNRPEPGVAWA